jgi:hypothetical protein
MKLDDKIKREIEEDMEKIQVPNSLYEFAKNIKEENDLKEQKNHPAAKKSNKKKYQFAAAAMIGLGLLTGSTFLNPTMAEMASKIPYLGQVFKTKPVYEMLNEALVKEGYKNISIGMTPGERVQFEIRLEGSEKDADRERENITNVTEKILKSKGYDSYDIKVTSYIPEISPLTEEEKQMTELALKLEESLRKAGYEILTVNPFNDVIEVAIPLTEEKRDELIAETLTLAKANGSEKDVKLEIVDVEKNQRESIWMDYLRSIHEGLALKREYKVRGYGYSYKQDKMKIFIKTSMSAADPDAKETVAKIRNEIKTFIDHERVNKSIEKDEYEIIIRDKSGKDFDFPY